ncbi:pseudouridine synthase [Spiroplasma tabanidicola]|uniref:RNA pseudouridylate synthase n=1 Tax=Spiroplasma tabanidicola TaxID=324079 RepID=A0A6I6C704_9MOLU|nr:RluA family pseudouridine synthase [Spiroplasma tabanidicola]QGS51566.1 ribosomal large subunit pseudouridine synthase C [Spiroplasma tabanidicola]
MTILKVNKNDENQTIFNFIKKNFKTTSLSVIYKWFRTNKIKLNEKRIKDQKRVLKLGDEIKVYDSASISKRNEEKLVDYSELKIIYEDENLLIVDKPSNLEMHSLINICLDQIVRSYLIDTNKYDVELENSFVISHVHRLDKLTKGLVIYAKNKKSLDILLQAIQDKDNIEKFYLAKLENNNIKTGLIEGFIDYNSDTQLANFSLKDNKFFKSCSQEQNWFNKEENILEVKLLTGRKHQIRAICSYFKSPIVDDFRYGAKKSKNRSIDLIAYKLIFKNFSDELSYLNDKEFCSTFIF